MILLNSSVEQRVGKDKILGCFWQSACRLASASDFFHCSENTGQKQVAERGVCFEWSGDTAHHG